MPLLVARQWPAVTHFHAALASRRLAQRFYTAPPPSTSGLREGARRQPISGGILIPDSVQTQPHHLFESIKPLSPLHAAKRNFAVFFVTPSYAHSLLDDDAFLRTALQRIYKEAIGTPDLTISALCAVVDKLPASQPWNDRTLESQISLRKQTPPVAGTGFEGIAYISLPSHASVPSNQSPVPSEHGAIEFITADYVFNDDICLDTLRLPLANTVFQTGMPTTMFHSSWKTDGKTGQLTQVAKTTPSRHAIRLVEGGDASRLKSTLSVPLLPLTLPRVVEGCMGNIIRRVVDAEGKSIQASSELENVVPRFFSSRNQPAQTTVAWALVIPKNLKHKISTRTEDLLARLSAEDGPNSTDSGHAWERLWRSHPPVWNTLVSQALSEGARLHRVLSGGGGWGKKAGLLSLDPAPANTSSELPSGLESLATIDDPENFESTLTPVVQDGDSIQFFTLPKSELAQEARESDNYETVSKLTDANDSEGWELGTIPSTMDSIPGESWQHIEAEKHRVAFFQGSFGALTEGALTMTRHRRKGVDRTSSVYTTTLDVPFSRFWAVNLDQSHNSTTRHEDRNHVGKDKDSVPNSNKLHLSSSTNVSNSCPRNVRNVWVDTLSNHVKTGHLRHILNWGTPVHISRFSSTAPAQDPQPKNTALGPKSSTADTEWSQSTNQESRRGNLQWNPTSSFTVIKGLQNSAPNMSIPELTRALGVTGVHKSGRLRARTARIMMHEIRRRFNEQLFEYRAIASGRYKQTSGRANFQSTKVRPELGDTNKGESVTRQFPLEDKGNSRTKEKSTRRGSQNTQKKLLAGRKDNTHETAQNKGPSSPKKKKKNTPALPIRKLSVQPKPEPEALSKSLRMLSFQVSRLADEAGALIVAIHSRQPRRPAQPSQARSSSSKSPRFLHRRQAARPRLSTSRPRVRHVQAHLRPRVTIKLHPSFSLGTIRFADGSRAKLKRRAPSPRRHHMRRLYSRSLAREGGVLRRVPVATQRKREAGRLRRRREREARRLAETVESWLGGTGAGGTGGIV